jgi:hypothetical protein
MNSPRSRPPFRLLLVLAAVAAAVLGLVVPAAAAEPFCGITWGSLEKTADTADPAGVLTNVRAGQHDCYDRLVIDMAGGPGAAYDVRYVPQVIADGSGLPVALRGGAFLQIAVRVPAYDVNGNATYAPADPQELVDTTGFATFRQAALAGSFEGVTNLGLGVRAHLPFRVFTLAGPGCGGRVVIDVAHDW